MINRVLIYYKNIFLLRLNIASTFILLGQKITEEQIILSSGGSRIFQYAISQLQDMGST